MKLKKLLWIGVLFLPLIACEDPDTTTQTKTKIQLLISLSPSELKSMQITDVYSFEGETVFCLANKDNSYRCPQNILHVTPDVDAKMIFPAFTGELYQLNLEWGYATLGDEEYQMQSPVVLLSESLSGGGDTEINLGEVLLPLIEKIDNNPNTLIKLVLYGNSESVISAVSKIEIPLLIEHEVLTPRFTL